MDQPDIITATYCECCDNTTYNIPLNIDNVSIVDGDVTVHLDQEEMFGVYLELKEYITGIKDPVVLTKWL